MKNKKGLKIFVIVTLVALFFGVKGIIERKNQSSSFMNTISQIGEFSNSDEFDDEDFDDDFKSSDSFTKIFSKTLGKTKDSSKKTNSPYVSVIYINGVISEENRTYNQKWLLKQIKKAKNDPKNRGILLNINSPGGTVYESDEAYLALQAYKRETNRPIFAYFSSLAASGGYYIGCAANYIYANRNTLTGSIGVIAGESVDATGLLEKIGIKMTTITAGRNKNMGNYNSVLTDEQRAIMQSIADEAYEQFTEIVAKSRDMDINKVKTLADGRIYTAKQAKENGLIDFVFQFEEAKEDIRDYFLGKWNSHSDESNDSEDLNSEKEKGEVVEFIERKYYYEENWISLLSGATSFLKNPEASVYKFLGDTSTKCLYLYQ